MGGLALARYIPHKVWVVELQKTVLTVGGCFLCANVIEIIATGVYWAGVVALIFIIIAYMFG